MGTKLTRAEIDDLVRRGATIGPAANLPRHATQLPRLLRVVIPLELPSMANVRMHWAKKARIVKSQRQIVGLSLRSLILPPLPATVIMTRIGPRKLDDDNLASALKATRDEIAAAYNVDDGSELYTWIPQQRKGTAAVEIQIIAKELA